MARPFIVAGPCSAESQAQVRETAQVLSRLGVDFFRAGVWKPRSRPGSFEGIGATALAWLSAVQEEFQLPTATEVATPAHVEAVLSARLQGVWIGARTSVNPFAVQEIATALSGTGLMVFVKNPVNPDLALWLGALERFQKCGIKRIAAVHRGFSVYGGNGYRNAPIWLIPIELKRQMPHVPLLCDPSHIAGESQRVSSIAQKAMDLHFDGLMTEVHPDPDRALSDTGQQLSIPEFERMMTHLIIRSPDSSNVAAHQKIEGLRSQIDLLDDQMVDTLGQRMRIVHQIGTLKREEGMTILQRARWDGLMGRIRRQGDLSGVSPRFIEQLFALIHQEAILRQQQVMQPEALETDSECQIPDFQVFVRELERRCTMPHIDSLAHIGEWLQGKKAVMLVDKKIDMLYPLPQHPKILIDAQERTKSVETVQRVVYELMNLEADKTTWLVGIGGGIVCDITGFVASIYMRGVPFALVPTTLLAQVDAAIGGKNGVNVAGKKNMAGTITQPKWIACDPQFLHTLPAREVRSGLAEVIKHALIGDAALLDYIENHVSSLLSLAPEPVRYLLAASHRLKCGVVARDEFDQGLRRMLNFGHTVGHAMEACMSQTQDGCTHGEAVALGMLYAVALSIKYAQFGASLLPRLKKLYTQLSLPTQPPCSVDAICKAILFDKKREAQSIFFVLLKGIGVPYQQEIGVKEVQNALQSAHEQLLSP